MTTHATQATLILRGWASDPKAHPGAAGRLSAMLPEESRPIMFAHQGIQPRINVDEALLWLGIDAAPRGDARRALAVAGLIENTPEDPLWRARLIAAVRREKAADDEHFSAMNIEARRPDGNLQRFAHLLDRTDETRVAYAAALAEIDRLLGEAIGGGNQAAPAGDDAEDEAQPPALKPRERNVLLAMAEHGPESLLFVDAIARESRASETTTGRGLAGLIEHGLAERPEGEREAARLTNRGRRLARKIDC